MKIKLVGSKEEDRQLIKEVLHNLNCCVDIEEINEENKFKYHIKHTPAIIIDNVVISEDSKLSKNELRCVIQQFLET